ncbi:unnamed protein product [Absidia cylindrospora]
MKLLSLGFAFGLLSSSIGVMARSTAYFPASTENESQTPATEVSLNTFSAWMAHMMGTSESHPLLFWEGSHTEEAMLGIQSLWSRPTYKKLLYDSARENVGHTSFMVISGVDDPEALFPSLVPSLYITDDNAQDFMELALDNMVPKADNFNPEKDDNGMASTDIKTDQLIDSFKTHYASLVNTNVFNASNKADQAFMVEIEMIRGMLDKGAIVEMAGLELLAQEHGTQATVYKDAQQIVSNLISNHLPQQTTLIVTPWIKKVDRRAVPVEKINAVSDFQLLFWTGVFLVLVTSGILVFVYQLGGVDSGNVVLTSTALPKQD